MSAYEWREAPAGPRYAVIGNPIAHSKSPAMQSAAFAATGLGESYVAVRVPEAEFDEAINHLVELGYRGLNVTLPLKERAAEWAQQLTDRALRIKSANTLDLVNRVADSTDGPGFLADLQRYGTFKRALVLGAGGSARAVVNALRDHGVDVSIWARRSGQASQLAQEVGGHTAQFPSTNGFDLVVDATSAGLAGVSLPIEWGGKPGLAYALAYGAAAIAFLDQARANGWKTADGLGMLVEQGAIAFTFWTGKPAPVDVMRTAVMNL